MMLEESPFCSILVQTPIIIAVSFKLPVIYLILYLQLMN